VREHETYQIQQKKLGETRQPLNPPMVYRTQANQTQVHGHAHPLLSRIATLTINDSHYDIEEFDQRHLGAGNLSRSPSYGKATRNSTIVCDSMNNLGGAQEHRILPDLSYNCQAQTPTELDCTQDLRRLHHIQSVDNTLIEQQNDTQSSMQEDEQIKPPAPSHVLSTD